MQTPSLNTTKYTPAYHLLIPTPIFTFIHTLCLRLFIFLSIVDQRQEDWSYLQAIIPTLTSLPNEILCEVVRYSDSAYHSRTETPDLTLFNLLYVSKQLRDIAIDVYAKASYTDLSDYHYEYMLETMQEYEIRFMAREVAVEIGGRIHSCDGLHWITFSNAPFRLACIVDNMFPGRSWDFMRQVGEEAQFFYFLK